MSVKRRGAFSSRNPVAVIASKVAISYSVSGRNAVLATVLDTTRARREVPSALRLLLLLRLRLLLLLPLPLPPPLLPLLLLLMLLRLRLFALASEENL